MTVLREYRCNICNCIEKKNPDKDRDLIGYKFVDGGEIVQKGSREVENHICHQCLRNFKRLAETSGVGI